MISGTRSYVEVVPPGLPWAVLAPASRANDAIWSEGATALLAAAIGAYNASIEALRAGDVPAAIGHAERAVTLMPYAPHLLEYVAVLAMRHGDFELADRVLHTAQDLGLDEFAATHRVELERRVAAWNDVLADPALRSPSESEDPEAPGYRELLLARSRDGGGSVGGGIAQAHGAPAASPSTQHRVGARGWAVLASTAVLALAMGAFIGVRVAPGFTGASATPAGTPPAERAPTTPNVSGDGEQPDVHEESQPSTKALLALASGDASGAADLIVAARSEGARGDELDAVEELAGERLVATAEPAWRARRYDEVLRVLRPLGTLEATGHPDGLYYLGVAAEAAGEDDTALRAFSRYVAVEASRSQPHRRAQAAYSAARLASGTEAVGFAEIVSEEFPGTLYDNSMIRDIVSNGAE